MQQSGLSLPFVFVCAFFMTSSHPFSIVAFASGINIAWDERSFVCASRFPEACVSERQISRVIWTIPNSRFAKFADQNHLRSSYFLLPRFTLESISYSPEFFRGYLKNLVSQIREPTCACFHLQRTSVKSFLRIFSPERILAQSCNNVQNSVFSLQYQIQLNLCCLTCFGFANPLTASYISSRRSFVQ